MRHGGEFRSHNAMGGKSVYGEQCDDENCIPKQTGPGILSMANAAPGANRSQFFICTAKTKRLGKVREGTGVVGAAERFGPRDAKSGRKITLLTVDDSNQFDLLYLKHQTIPSVAYKSPPSPHLLRTLNSR